MIYGIVLILSAIYLPLSTIARNVYIFDPEEDTFTSGPSLIYDRFHSACTIFNSPQHNNRPVVLAAGGNSQPSAEVYDYTNASQWETSIHPIISNM